PGVVLSAAPLDRVPPFADLELSGHGADLVHVPGEQVPPLGTLLVEVRRGGRREGQVVRHTDLRRGGGRRLPERGMVALDCAAAVVELAFEAQAPAAERLLARVRKAGD